MSLPFLPGYSFNAALSRPIYWLGKNKFHRSQHFGHNNGIGMLLGEDRPGIGGELLPGQKTRTKNSMIPSGDGSALPSWVAFDRQVLCFDAFFQEAVHEKREEQYRVRHCKIYFYLEDDSIQVVEPRMKNSGIPQGTLIRRHRVPKPAPRDDEFYTVEDFTIGKEINLYSKVFKISSCDPFTQNFMRKLGVRMPGDDEKPSDPYMQYRKAMDDSMEPLRPYEKKDTLKQFLDHDRHVLRFFCYWDDTDSMFGDPREMILHYFLADDTIEIREVIPPNSGRDAAPMFLRRGKLPKNIENLKQPGVFTDRTVLNVFGPTGHGGRYILDSLKTGAVHTEFYIDSDLTVGAVLNVWGRKLQICDCDDFTKEYYRTKFGIEEFGSVDYKKPTGVKFSKQYPPYNGFGSEEDSLCSCMGLLPKPPKRDFLKFMEKDRHGLESNVLRFLARMDTTKPIDVDRRFIISYFLSDDSLLVFEPPVRNSGIIGGKFLERGRVKKPSQPMYSTELSAYYKAYDLFVGAQVQFNSFNFVLIDADEYAFHYMEQHLDEFPMSNIYLISQRVQALASERKDQVKTFFQQHDPTGRGLIPYEKFHSLILQLTRDLSEQEIMTLARHFSPQVDNDGVNIQNLIAVIQEDLRKKNFESFGKLIEGMMQIDTARQGELDADSVRTVVHAHHVPVADELLRSLLGARLQENGKVSYRELIHEINWRDNPVPPSQRLAINTDEGWNGTRDKMAVNEVNYLGILEDVFGIKE